MVILVDGSVLRMARNHILSLFVAGAVLYPGFEVWQGIVKLRGVMEVTFEPRYSKAKQYVQILRAAPRVPHSHGVSTSTKLKNGEMRAAVHCALLRKHHCDSALRCGKAQAAKHIRKIPVSLRKRVLVQGGDVRALLDKTGVLGEWRATEAETQTLAARADVTRT